MAQVHALDQRLRVGLLHDHHVCTPSTCSSASIILGFLLWRLLAGHYGGRDHEPVGTGILYWHFVDVVWVFVYSSLYLSVTLL